MRAVIQRVSYAKVTVDNKIIASIDEGILLLVGFEQTDNQTSMNYILNKTINMRIFEDSDNKMNLSLLDINRELLIVPNFTLYGDGRKGNRPSYSSGSNVLQAQNQYNEFIQLAKATSIYIQTGIFQADMQVELINNGPVTILLDSDKLF